MNVIIAYRTLHFRIYNSWPRIYYNKAFWGVCFWCIGSIYCNSGGNLAAKSIFDIGNCQKQSVIFQKNNFRPQKNGSMTCQKLVHETKRALFRRTLIAIKPSLFLRKKRMCFCFKLQSVGGFIFSIVFTERKQASLRRSFWVWSIKNTAKRSTHSQTIARRSQTHMCKAHLIMPCARKRARLSMKKNTSCWVFFFERFFSLSLCLPCLVPLCACAGFTPIITGLCVQAYFFHIRSIHIINYT